jgi:hypothetical protein
MEKQEEKRKLADIKHTCCVCGVRGRVGDEDEGIMWVGCDSDVCASGTGWFHHESLEDGDQVQADLIYKHNAACE